MRKKTNGPITSGDGSGSSCQIFPSTCYS
jgi:hypothetical protein